DHINSAGIFLFALPLATALLIGWVRSTSAQVFLAKDTRYHGSGPDRGRESCTALPFRDTGRADLRHPAFQVFRNGSPEGAFDQVSTCRTVGALGRRRTCWQHLQSGAVPRISEFIAIVIYWFDPQKDHAPHFHAYVLCTRRGSTVTAHGKGIWTF